MFLDFKDVFYYNTIYYFLGLSPTLFSTLSIRRKELGKGFLNVSKLQFKPETLKIKFEKTLSIQ